MIDKEQVEHIAKLARISLAKEEKERLQKELSSILDYIEKLKQVDVSNVDAALHTQPCQTTKGGLRKDEAKEKKAELAKKLIGVAPGKEKGFIKTKPIF